MTDNVKPFPGTPLEILKEAMNDAAALAYVIVLMQDRNGDRYCSYSEIEPHDMAVAALQLQQEAFDMNFPEEEYEE